MATKHYLYYVEGEDDKKVVDTLKKDMKLIIPGIARVFNVVENVLTNSRLITIKENTTVILVFDTDTGKVDKVKKNIEILKNSSNVKEIICITQVKNLEEELVRSCNIKSAQELTSSKSVTNYKRDIKNITNLDKKLKEHNFDIEKFWSKNDPVYEREGIKNEADKIKIKYIIIFMKERFLNGTLRGRFFICENVFF